MVRYRARQRSKGRDFANADCEVEQGDILSSLHRAVSSIEAAYVIIHTLSQQDSRGCNVARARRGVEPGSCTETAAERTKRARAAKSDSQKGLETQANRTVRVNQPFTISFNGSLKI